jgi:transposase-like protein
MSSSDEFAIVPVWPMLPNFGTASEIETLMRRQAVTDLHEQGLSDRAIARVIRCSSATVRKWRTKEGLPANYAPFAPEPGRMLNGFGSPQRENKNMTILLDPGPPVSELTKLKQPQEFPEEPLRTESAGPNSPKSVGASIVLCPNCFGKKIVKTERQGKPYSCIVCQIDFCDGGKVDPCPSCGRVEVVQRKSVRWLSRGVVKQVYMRCTLCKQQWALFQGSKMERYPNEVYRYAFIHALKGESLRDIRYHLMRDFRADVTPAGINIWIRKMITDLAPYLLTSKLNCSGVIFLDEMWNRAKHRASDRRKFYEDFWQWNSYDMDMKSWLAARLSKDRNALVAADVIKATIDRVNIPENGIDLYTDKLGSYKTGYDRLIAKGILDPNTVRLYSIPKTEDYSGINPIEGFHSRLRGLQRQKLRVRPNSFENAERRLLGEIMVQNFFEPRKEFGGKTVAVNAGVRLRFDDPVALSHMLRAAKYRRYIVTPKRITLRVGATEQTAPQRLMKI